MSTAPIRGTIQIAHKSAAEWAAQNTVLLAGQLGLETDTLKLKAGDGTSTWLALGYITGTGGGGGAQVFTDLSDATTSNLPAINSPLTAALATKATTTQLAAKQDALVSGTTIKTVAGQSVIGSGNVALAKTDVGLSNVDNTSDVNKPVSTATQTALNTKQATLASGSNIRTVNGGSLLGSGDLVVPGDTPATVSIAYNSTIPLDTTGNGKRMTSHTMTGDTVLSVGTAVDGGNCAFALVGAGGYTLDVSAFTAGNDYTFDTSTGANNVYAAVYQYNTPFLFGALGASIDTDAPTLSSASVPDSDPFRINLVWSENMNSAVSGPTAFAVSSGHPLTSHIYDTATTSHLVTSTAFNSGETKTLAYTQPGSFPMKDTAGNLLATFSGFAITDNVSVPTLVSATVANATPGRIDLVWSEAMNSTVSAVAAFTVNAGHPLTAHTYVDSTHSYLTTSANFIASESRTLSYTQPGSNKMQDTGGSLVASFSGFAITDNVSGGGATLSQSSLAIGSSLDLSAGTYTDYFFNRASTGANLQKTPRPYISGITITNMNLAVAGGTWPTLSATDFVNANDGSAVGFYSGAEAQRYVQAAAGANSVSFTIPAGTGAQTLRVHFGGERNDGFGCAGRCKLTCTLSDASAGPLSITTAAPLTDGTTVTERHDIVFAAGSGGQTLTLTFEAAAGSTSGDFICIQLLALT